MRSCPAPHTANSGWLALVASGVGGASLAPEAAAESVPEEVLDTTTALNCLNCHIDVRMTT